MMLGYFGAEMVTAVWYDGTAGTNVKGVWTPGTSAGQTIRIIAPQPVKANELENLPDGEHVADYVRTWTEKLAVSTRGGLSDSDLIAWDGKTYKVAQVDDREVLGGFVRVLMKKVG